MTKAPAGHNSDKYNYAAPYTICTVLQSGIAKRTLVPLKKSGDLTEMIGDGIMRRVCFGLILLLLLLPVVTVQAEPHPLSQIPLFSFENNKIPNDIAFIVNRYWGQFYNRSGPKSFGPDSLRHGFIDLNNDGAQDLILLVEHPAWASGDGYVMLLATWSKNLGRWLTIGWGWGDAETLFSTDEVIGAWRTLDTGSQYLAWNGTIYKSRKKPSVVLK